MAQVLSIHLRRISAGAASAQIEVALHALPASVVISETKTDTAGTWCWARPVAPIKLLKNPASAAVYLAAVPEQAVVSTLDPPVLVLAPASAVLFLGTEITQDYSAESLCFLEAFPEPASVVVV